MIGFINGAVVRVLETVEDSARELRQGRLAIGPFVITTRQGLARVAQRAHASGRESRQG